MGKREESADLMMYGSVGRQKKRRWCQRKMSTLAEKLKGLESKAV